MHARWQLFRVFGIPISIDASWLIVLVLMTLNLAEMFSALLPSDQSELADQRSTWIPWAMALTTAVAFFGCIILHELGHAVVARQQRMSIRGITLFLFGGVAEIVDEPPSAKAELLMTVAGPAVSLVLVGTFALLAALGEYLGWPLQIVVVLGYLAVINALVLVFNLIPAFPLDGGRVLRSILWALTGNLRRSTFWAATSGRGFAWALFVLAGLHFFAGNWIGGIWFGLVGLFLAHAAQSGYQDVIIREALGGEPISRFMTQDPITVPGSMTLKRWVDDIVYRHHRKGYPVVSQGRLEGYVETDHLASIPKDAWENRTVGDVMSRELEPILISPQTDALEAMRRMQRSGSSRLLVTDGDRLLGILSMKDLLQFLNLKIELEGTEAGENHNGRHVSSTS